MEINLNNKNISDFSWGHIFNRLNYPLMEKELIVEKIIEVPVAHYVVLDSADLLYAKTHRVFTMKDFLSVEHGIFLKFLFFAILRREIEPEALVHYDRGKDKWWKRVLVVIDVMSHQEAKMKGVKLKKYLFWKMLSCIINTYKKLYFLINNTRKD